MHQLNLFNDAVTLGKINKPNDHGVVEPEEVIAYGECEIRLARNVQSRWMWACAVRFNHGGHSFGISGKNGEVEDTKQKAILAAIAYMLPYIKGTTKQERQTIFWLQNGAPKPLKK